jgi:hypothetical protein
MAAISWSESMEQATDWNIRGGLIHEKSRRFCNLGIESGLFHTLKKMYTIQISLILFCTVVFYWSSVEDFQQKADFFELLIHRFLISDICSVAPNAMLQTITNQTLLICGFTMCERSMKQV